MTQQHSPTNKMWAAVLALLMTLSGPAGALAQARPEAVPAPSTFLPSQGTITLRVQTPTYQRDGREVRVPGYGTNSIPGAPALPVWSTVVELPAVGQPTITVAAGTAQLLSQPAALAAVPVPQPAEPKPYGWSNAEDLLTAIPTLDRPDPAIYRADAFYPAALAQAGAPQWQNGRRLLPVRVFPFQYNPVAGLLRYYADLQVIVSMGESQGAGAQEALSAGARDAMSQGAVNPAALPMAGGGSLRINTGARGLHRLTWQDLDTAGVPLATADPATFGVSYLGEPVDIRLVDQDADGKFDVEDLVIFYAEPYVGRYQTSNVYWFSFGGLPSPAMSTRSASSTGSEPIVTEITQTLHIENNVDYRSVYPRPRDADHWFDNVLYPNSGGPTAVRTYDLALDDALTDGNRSVVLRAVAHGGTDQAADPDQSLLLRLNSHDAGLYQWNGSTDTTITATLPAAWLDASPNQVSLVASLDQLPDLPYYWISPDWVELSYPALADADGTNWIYIEGTAPGANRVQVTGFTTAEVGVYDIRDPRHPVELLTTKFDDSTGTLSFWDDDLPAPAYALSSEDALLAPIAIELDTPSIWGSPGQEVNYDYIAIVHSSLWNEIDPLLAHRSNPLGDNFRVAKVDVQDIYDEFSYGRRDPEAIRSFLGYAYNHWNARGPRPQYVLLVGSGTYDFTGAFVGATKPNLIPPYLVNVDPWLGEVPADNRFVSLDGENDFLPEMHIGRIPAQNGAHVTAAVNKILAYENSAAAGDWQRRAVFVADECTNYAGDFHALSDMTRLGWLPESYADRTVYYGDPVACPESSYATVAGMAAGISSEFNDAALMLQWFGHGSRFRWGGAGAMFLSTYVLNLTANTTWPVTFHYSCWTGYFVNMHRLAGVNYDDRTLGEMLILAAQRGSVADLAPSGQHVGDALVGLNQGIARAIFQDATDRMGRATDAGKLYYWSQMPGYADVIDSSILFGDPATRLRLPPLVSAAAGSGSSVTLRWQHVSQYTAYEVWRSTQPYFAPGDPDAVLVGTLTGPFSEKIIFFDQTGALGNAAINYFYVVQGVNTSNTTAVSNRAGEFDFVLAAGE